MKTKAKPTHTPGPRTSDCENCGAKWHGAAFKGVSLCPLHAAAPDLLAAAKAMVEGWDEFVDTENEGQMDSAATQIPKLRAAIAKAEGR